jgi:putative SOS response-associated peptidase YedK
MCGRFVSKTSPQVLGEYFGVDETAIVEHEPDFNVTPRREIITVSEHEATRVLGLMRWGLIPSWAKDTAIGDKMINARAESVAEKPAFKRALAKRRCIITADGFYEWMKLDDPPEEEAALMLAGVDGPPSKKKPKVRKQPMYIHARDDAPLAFAGIFERWHDPKDEDAPVLVSCSIITTAGNATMQPIHDRMPVILPASAWDQWLDRDLTDTAAVVPLLVPAPDSLLDAYPVSTAVNNPRHNAAELLRHWEIA